MVQHNSGDNLLVRDTSGVWQALSDMYFEEGKCYDWQCTAPSFRLSMQSIPLPMTKSETGWCGVMAMPFQIGELQFEYVVGQEKVSLTQYVYPDQRKLCEHDFRMMLHDILAEASILFRQSGLTQNVKASNFTNKPSFLQWHYIEENMMQLRTIFRKISERPLKSLVQHEELTRREQVKQVTDKTMRWLEIYGPARGSTPTKPPEFVQQSKKQETYDVLENRVMLKHLTDLQNLLRKYKAFSPEIQQKAERYLDWISSWKRQPFLQNVQMAAGKTPITQVFRKHPVYRLWFNWFYDLNEFKDLTLDIQQKLALKDTFALYEMWCFIKVIQHVRKLGFLQDASSLFVLQDEQYFLHLQENKASKIRLTDGSAIYFQKIIQSNSSPYYSYTQRMIPDIVIQKGEQLYILDPKYRVHANIHLALAEMHKYRDGILHRDTDEKIVQEVYILSPQRGKMSETKDFYSRAFQERYQMGAFCVSPSGEESALVEWLNGLFTEKQTE